MMAATKNAFEPAAKAGIVFVDFWASWCDPCRVFRSVYQAARARHPAITFASVNVDDDPGMLGMLRIASIPTLMAFRDGILVYVHGGVLLGDTLDELVERMRRLNMASVRHKLARFAG